MQLRGKAGNSVWDLIQTLAYPRELKMEIPTKPACFKMMNEMGMMDHIVAHSLMVCRVSILLADTLAGQGISIDRRLVSSSSLLHDITKTRSFSTGENHALTGDTFLREKNYPELASIVGAHVRLSAYSSSTNPSETEIVNYADKRVLHDQVVTLKERMTYILERYGKSREMDRKLQLLWDKTVELETKLFEFMPFSPDELEHHIDMEKYRADLIAYGRLCGRNDGIVTEVSADRLI